MYANVILYFLVCKRMYFYPEMLTFSNTEVLGACVFSLKASLGAPIHINMLSNNVKYSVVLIIIHIY